MLTTERLREIAEDGFLEHGDAKALSAEILANREAQQVITKEVIDRIVPYINPEGIDEVEHCCEYNLYLDRARIRKELRELYTAPPAPAVPAPAVPPEKKLPELMMASYHEAIGWNACRAAMLAQPVSQGKLPEWIACGEQLPAVGETVLVSSDGYVSVGELERSGANYRYFTSVATGRELTVTHWMPLPAAPGVVKQ